MLRSKLVLTLIALSVSGLAAYAQQMGTSETSNSQTTENQSEHRTPIRPLKRIRQKMRNKAMQKQQQEPVSPTTTTK